MSFRDLLENDVETGYEEYDDFEGELEDHPAYKDLEISLEEYKTTLEKIEIIQELEKEIKLYGVSQKTAIVLEELHTFLSDRVPLYTYTKEGSNINQIYVEEGIGDFINSVFAFLLKHIGKIILAIVALITFIMRNKDSSGGGSGGGDSTPLVEAYVKPPVALSEEVKPTTVKEKKLTEEEFNKRRRKLAADFISKNGEAIKKELFSKFNRHMLFEILGRGLENKETKGNLSEYVLENLKHSLTQAIEKFSTSEDDMTLIEDVLESYVVSIMRAIKPSIIDIKRSFDRYDRLKLKTPISLLDKKPSDVIKDYFDYLSKLFPVISSFKNMEFDDMEKIITDSLNKTDHNKDTTAFYETALKTLYEKHPNIDLIIKGNHTVRIPFDNECDVLFNRDAWLVTKHGAKQTFYKLEKGKPVPNFIQKINTSDVIRLISYREDNDPKENHILLKLRLDKILGENKSYIKSTIVENVASKWKNDFPHLNRSVEEMVKDYEKYEKDFAHEPDTVSPGFFVNGSKEKFRQQMEKEHKNLMKKNLRDVMGGFANLLIAFKLVCEEAYNVEQFNNSLSSAQISLKKLFSA